MLHWLAKQPMVHWLAPEMQRSWNNLMAGAVVQGTPGAAAIRGPQDALPLGMHPLWAAGIRGEGQILGIGDSGVDMDNCYFFDPKVGMGAILLLLLLFCPSLDSPSSAHCS